MQGTDSTPLSKRAPPYAELQAQAQPAAGRHDLGWSAPVCGTARRAAIAARQQTQAFQGAQPPQGMLSGVSQPATQQFCKKNARAAWNNSAHTCLYASKSSPCDCMKPTHTCTLDPTLKGSSCMRRKGCTRARQESRRCGAAPRPSPPLQARHTQCVCACNTQHTDSRSPRAPISSEQRSGKATSRKSSSSQAAPTHTNAVRNGRPHT